MSTSTASSSILDRLAGHVARRAIALQTGYERNGSSAVADLAVLRRSVGKPLGTDIRAIALTLDGLHQDGDRLPDDRPTRAEHAAYTALTLFALHQRSQREVGMHKPGQSFGTAVRMLGRHASSPDAVRARLTAAATSATLDEFTHHARGLITQLRSAGISLDYGAFAKDLFLLQSPHTADQVRLRWGRDFYRVTRDNDDERETSGDAVASDSALS